MRVSSWNDYELIDTSSGERLERFKDIVLIRPDPQIIWDTPKDEYFWNNAHARYIRSNTGGGRWENFKKTPESWKIKYKDITLNLKMMGFKHTGVFPEQAVNWGLIQDVIINSKRPLKVLNLFAYTGAATIACVKAGANVCHVDSSKGMVLWAKENAKDNNLPNDKIRWIVDDCLKFVNRELRRNSKYDIIIMDPPSYGRGPNGEIWKLEKQLFNLLKMCEQLLSENPVALFLNSYTAGLSANVMKYIAGITLQNNRGGSVYCSEIGLPVTKHNKVLPCGSTAFWLKSEENLLDIN